VVQYRLIHGVWRLLSCDLPIKITTSPRPHSPPRTETVKKAELRFGFFVRSIVHIVPEASTKLGVGGGGVF